MRQIKYVPTVADCQDAMSNIIEDIVYNMDEQVRNLEEYKQVSNLVSGLRGNEKYQYIVKEWDENKLRLYQKLYQREYKYRRV